MQAETKPLVHGHFESRDGQKLRVDGNTKPSSEVESRQDVLNSKRGQSEAYFVSTSFLDIFSRCYVFNMNYIRKSILEVQMK